jgi:hypothetical protein
VGVAIGVRIVVVTSIKSKPFHNNSTIHQNKTNSLEYGLKVFASTSSTIQLVSPLTKEQVAVDNGGGGNWGGGYMADISLINTIEASLSSSAPVGETKSNGTSEPEGEVL